MIALLKISKGYNNWLLLCDLSVAHISELAMRSPASAIAASLKLSDLCENHGVAVGVRIHGMIEVFSFLRLCMQSLGKENLLRQCICLFFVTEVYMLCGKLFCEHCFDVYITS